MYTSDTARQSIDMAGYACIIIYCLADDDDVVVDVCVYASQCYLAQHPPIYSAHSIVHIRVCTLNVYYICVCCFWRLCAGAFACAAQLICITDINCD